MKKPTIIAILFVCSFSLISVLSVSAQNSTTSTGSSIETGQSATSTSEESRGNTADQTQGTSSNPQDNEEEETGSQTQENSSDDTQKDEDNQEQNETENNDKETLDDSSDNEDTENADSDDGDATPQGEKVDIKELDLIAFGDSLVEGVGSSGGGFVTDLQNWIDIAIDNEGQSGNTTQDGLDRLEEDVLSKDPHIVMVLLGNNDIFQGVPLEETLDNLEEIILEIQDTGASVILLGAHGEFFNFDREEEYEDLANQTGAYYVPDLLDDILGNPDLLSDPVHPNDEGYELMAERIFPILQEAIADTPTDGTRGSCEPSESQVTFDEEVTWSAYIVGGNSGDFDYIWSGSDGLSGDDRTEDIDYDTEGVKSASVQVSTDGEETKTFECSPNVTVIPPPLSGSCTFEVDIDDMEIEWEADVTGGGTNDYEFQWSGTGGLNATSANVTKSYIAPGIKTAQVEIESGTQSLTLPCQGEIPEESDAFEDVRLSCDVEAAPFEIDEEIRWDVDAFGIDDDDVDVEWSGTDGLEGDDDNDQVARITYETTGTKEARARIDIDDQELDFRCTIRVVEEAGDGEGCFIATAAFGTPLAHEIGYLRQFRDTTLLPNPVGKQLVSLYYNFSPPVADIIREHEWLQSATRAALQPLIAAVK